MAIVHAKDSIKPFFYSLCLHILVLAWLVINYESHSKLAVVQNANRNTHVINAVVLSPQPAPKLQVKPLPPTVEPAPIIKKTISTPEPEKQVISIKPTKPKPFASDKVMQQLLADLKKQSQLKKKQHAKHKTQQAFANQLKLMAQKSLQQQMLQEQTRLANLRAAEVQGEINKYKALILQVISQHWLVPSTEDKHLYADLLIRLAPGGTVLDVKIIKSSGKEALDRSAEAAVLKSSPLPVPTDATAFAAFRQFVLRVKPITILTDAL